MNTQDSLASDGDLGSPPVGILHSISVQVALEYPQYINEH